MNQSEILITGASGQLGRALQALFPKAHAKDHHDLDITDKKAVDEFDWPNVRTIINAAAYTDVDGAETPEGEKLAWAVNDEAVENLASVASSNDILLIHIGTDYEFDGTKKEPYTEDDEVKPLGNYAKSKAAGSQKAMQAPKHFLIRTAWVVGDGKNFVRTMIGLGQKGIEPKVVADQVGRPTFTSELAKAIKFLLENNPAYGIYNVTNSGEPVSWAEFTRAIFEEAGFNLKVTDTTTKDYFASKPGTAPRPSNSVLDLTKIESIGFKPRDWRENLKEYLSKELS